MSNIAMNNLGNSEKETIKKLFAMLHELPGVQAERPKWKVEFPDGRRRRGDAEIDLTVAGRRYRLLVEVKKSLFPRDVQQAVWQLQDYVRALGRNESIIPILAAEFVSPGSMELLRQEKIGYYDTGGSLFIPARGAYFYIDKPPIRKIARSIRTLFRGKRAQVLLVLLHDPEHWFSVKTLAKMAKVSAATASETLTALEKFDWLASRGQGPSKERRLTQPNALLDDWKKQVLAGPKPSVRRYYVPATSDHDDRTNRLGQACDARHLEYVITQEAAAQRYAPFLSAVSRVSCRIAPGHLLDLVLKELDAREVTDGANLLIIETRSEGDFLFKERLDSLWFATPVQVYLDLLWAGGRAQQAAEHLRRERIRF